MQLHLKVINDELQRLGHSALLAKGDGYLYFQGGEATDWLDRTVRVRTINSLTLKQWIEEFLRLSDLNERIMRSARPGLTEPTETGQTAGSKRKRGTRTGRS